MDWPVQGVARLFPADCWRFTLGWMDIFVLLLGPQSVIFVSVEKKRVHLL